MTTYKINNYGTPKYNTTKIARTNNDIKYIVVHYTGSGTASTANIAKNNCIYFNSGNCNASADFFIDNNSIWCFNNAPLKRYTWHCGDGNGRYGITNWNSIGIEVASNGADFTTQEINRLTYLVQYLMKKYDVSAKNVVRHYDASRKICPAPYCGTVTKDKKWKTLHAKITGTSTSTKTTTTTSTSQKYMVTADVLNIRAGSGTSYKIVGTIKKNDVYTIVEQKNGFGKLKSGAGWVSMSYMKKV